MNEHDILHQFLYTGGSVLLGLAGVGIKSLTSAWASKVRNQTVAQIIRNTDDVVMHVVKSIYQTHVKPRTRANRELSQQQGRWIRQRALQEIKQHLGRRALKDLNTSFGPDVDTVLRHHLEAAIQDIKYERSSPGGGVLQQKQVVPHEQATQVDTMQHPIQSPNTYPASPHLQEDWEKKQAYELKQIQEETPKTQGNL